MMNQKYSEFKILTMQSIQPPTNLFTFMTNQQLSFSSTDLKNIYMIVEWDLVIRTFRDFLVKYM